MSLSRVTSYQTSEPGLNGFPDTPGLSPVPTICGGFCGAEFDGDIHGVNIWAPAGQLLRRKSIPAATPLSAAYSADWLKRLWPVDDSSVCTESSVSAPRPSNADTAMRVKVSAAPRSEGRVGRRRLWAIARGVARTALTPTIGND